jgi:hypothetical protein
MAIPEKKIITTTMGDGSYVMDTRYFPLMMIAWIGLGSEALLDHYYEAREPYTTYAEQLGTKIVLIVDIGAMQVPSATVRKYISEKNIAVDSKLTCVHSYITIIPNSIMRGVITAISWLNFKGTIMNVPSFEAGLALATKIYQELGIDFPRPESTYKIPTIEGVKRK